MAIAPASKEPRHGILSLLWRRSIPLDIIQGLLVGYGLSLWLAWHLIGAQAREMMTTVNGWQTTQACGVPGGWLVEAACAETLPAINVPREAVYWQTTVDARGVTGYAGALQRPARKQFPGQRPAG